MEFTRVVLRPSPASTSLATSRRIRPTRLTCLGGDRRFADEGHLRYYEAAPPEPARKAVAKCRDMGFPAGDEARGILQAAELLLKEFGQIDEQEETTRKWIEEKASMKALKKHQKKAKKAMKMKDKKRKNTATTKCCNGEDSSSESSDSEREGVARTSRCATITARRVPSLSLALPLIMPQIPESVAPEKCRDVQISPEPETAMQCTTSSSNAMVRKPMATRIEVCTGGKCRKSSSLELLKEFERKVGVATAVACKCMGKCRQGPNVRLRIQGPERDTAQKGVLYTGVGLHDVGTILEGLQIQ